MTNLSQIDEKQPAKPSNAIGKRRPRNTRCNAQQEAFARHYATGPTTGNGALSYIKAYGKPKDWDRQRASAAAYQTIKKPHVAQRIQEIRDHAASLYLCDITSLAIEFDENRTVAHQEKQASAMNQATMGKAKVLGLVSDNSVTANVDLNRLYDQITGKTLADDVIEGAFKAIVSPAGEG